MPPGIPRKKCDITLHKPDANQACRAGTCQHTCQAPGKCGRQRGQSFRDDTDEHGRVRYGTGQREARDAQLKIEHDKRAEGASFIDPRAGREDFGAAVAPG